MTSIMQRPRSSHQADFPAADVNAELHRAAAPRLPVATVATGAAASTSASIDTAPQHATLSASDLNLSPPPPMPGMLGAVSNGQETAASSSVYPSFAMHLYPSSSAAAANATASTSGAAAGIHAALPFGDGPSTSAAEAIAGLGMGSGILDDPAILALAAQPFDPRTDFGPPEMPQYSSYEDHSAMAAATIATFPVASTSQHPTTHTLGARTTPVNATPSLNLLSAGGFGQSSSSSSSSPHTRTAAGALSELDLTSAGAFQFPELPASLLDQAPEYEYSVHTQANVFDAVQDYSGTGHDEAARLFGLDGYEAANLTLDGSGNARQAGPTTDGEEIWQFQEATYVPDPHTASSFSQHALSSGDGFATFPDASSMISSSEHPVEPSTAPTSRGSTMWKMDASMLQQQQHLQGGQQNNSPSFADAMQAKRRRDSMEMRNDGHMDATFAHPGHSFANVNMGGMHSHNGAATAVMNNYLQHHNAVGERQAPREPMVPSQSGVGGITRNRVSSWNGGDPTPRMHGGSAQWDASHSSSSFGTDGGYGSMSFGGQMLSMGGGGNNDGEGSVGSVADSMAAAARNEMINAISSTMDASIDTDGVAKCPYPNCSKTFAKNRSYNLKAHLRSHSQLKPFQCAHCPRAFSRKHDLERHSRVHSGDKPYLCEACGKGFPRSDALRRHWRVEKECGDKAVEIEAKQPLPSLPPGVNMPSAQAKGPTPGLMHFAPPSTTATAGGGMGMHMMAAGGGMNPFTPYHQGINIGGGGGNPYQSSGSMWESTMPYNYANGMERKRQRDD